MVVGLLYNPDAANNLKSAPMPVTLMPMTIPSKEIYHAGVTRGIMAHDGGLPLDFWA